MLYLLYFTLLYFTLLYFNLLYFTLLYFTLLYFGRTLLSSALSGYTIVGLSLFTSVIGIAISLYHFGTSSSQRFRGLPLGHFPTGWITSALLWGAVDAILLTCDHRLIFVLVCCLFCWFHVYSPSNFFVSDLSILVFLATFLLLSTCAFRWWCISSFTLVK